MVSKLENSSKGTVKDKEGSGSKAQREFGERNPLTEQKSGKFKGEDELKEAAERYIGQVREGKENTEEAEKLRSKVIELLDGWFKEWGKKFFGGVVNIDIDARILVNLVDELADRLEKLKENEDHEMINKHYEIINRSLKILKFKKEISGEELEAIKALIKKIYNIENKLNRGDNTIKTSVAEIIENYNNFKKAPLNDETTLKIVLELMVDEDDFCSYTARDSFYSIIKVGLPKNGKKIVKDFVLNFIEKNNLTKNYREYKKKMPEAIENIGIMIGELELKDKDNEELLSMALLIAGDRDMPSPIRNYYKKYLKEVADELPFLKRLAIKVGLWFIELGEKSETF